ncbi:WD40-repeat-containing domain protein [Syncephalastrum racemosum]|uniref:WD40-repeat-containing domain protein n=1 Tax=Syncephalastrum racemosum TaxID=13706 RepID=A0A1X2HMJ4_SYNRA|nr:WD40-repeat-containing domain protein [Syncephalastrum racemosum]
MADQEQVQVRFTTTQQKYAVNDAPILVPSALKRFGLSEIVNNLLGHEKPVPFDFLIDGEILKTSLAQYLSEKLLSTENVITLEYLESMLPPTQLSTYEHDDWISSVKGHQGYFLTGSYDNQTRVWNTSNECISTLVGPKDAVKTVAFGAFEGSSATIFAGSMDHTVTAWKFDVDDHSNRKLYECKGHKGPIEDIALNKSFDMLASASTDATIQLWSTSQEDTVEADTAEVTSGNKKRRKTEQTGQKIKVPKAALEGHVGTVSSVTFDPHDSSTLYSGGWDHSIRVWSLDDQVNTVTKVRG